MHWVAAVYTLPVKSIVPAEIRASTGTVHSRRTLPCKTILARTIPCPKGDVHIDVLTSRLTPIYEWSNVAVIEH